MRHFMQKKWNFLRSGIFSSLIHSVVNMFFFLMDSLFIGSLVSLFDDVKFKPWNLLKKKIIRKKKKERNSFKKHLE